MNVLGFKSDGCKSSKPGPRFSRSSAVAVVAMFLAFFRNFAASDENLGKRSGPTKKIASTAKPINSPGPMPKIML